MAKITVAGTHFNIEVEDDKQSAAGLYETVVALIDSMPAPADDDEDTDDDDGQTEDGFVFGFAGGADTDARFQDPVDEQTTELTE